MKIDEGVLVGYSNTSKAYRVFNNKAHRIKESRDIVFNENEPSKSLSL